MPANMMMMKVAIDHCWGDDGVVSHDDSDHVGSVDDDDDDPEDDANDDLSIVDCLC